MGQVQSEIPVEDPVKEESSEGKSNASMGDLIAEATAFGDDENESLEAKAQKALQCPCVAHLRSGPCGTHFSEAFLCYLKSTADEKGSDCVPPFIALQNCIKDNPDAFSKDILEDEDSKYGEKEPEYKMNAPEWAKERKPKL